MKIISLAAMLLLGQCAFGSVQRTIGNRTISYDNVIVAAQNKTISISVLDRSHILEEVASVTTRFRIERIYLINSRFLYADCKWWFFKTTVAWDLHNPERPEPMAITT